MRVLVIGAGLSGLAAACHLRGQGHEVLVVEREEQVGGRARTLSEGGYRFDVGPVVMTMPELLAEPLRAVGADPGVAVPMTRVDPSYRAHFADGSALDVHADMDALRLEIEKLCSAEEARGFDRLVAWLERLHEVEYAAFLDRDFDTPLDLVRSPARAAQLLRLGGLRSLDRVVASFLGDERLRRVFSFQALYAGVSPQQARAVLAVISYMDVVRGVWYPRGGIHAVARGLADALEDAGGQVLTGVAVREITRGAGGAADGVRTAGGDHLAADAVLSTADLAATYRSLLPGVDPPRSLRRARYAPSAVVWHLGVRGRPRAGTAHHNIHFGRQWPEAFDALIRRGTLMPDPSRLVTVPSVTDDTVAAPGESVLYVLEPVPHLGGRVDWPREAGPMRERLLGFLDEEGYPTDIEVERLVTPQDWAAEDLTRGTPFSLAHTFTQSGPFRPRNHEPRVPGLFFAGAGTTPGVGIPMVLLSGKHAARRVHRHVLARRTP